VVRSSVAQRQQSAAGDQRSGDPSGQDGEAGPGADREVVKSDGVLDGEACVAGCDLLDALAPARVGDDAEQDRDEVEQAEDDTDRGGRVPYQGGDADAEQRRSGPGRAPSRRRRVGLARRSGTLAQARTP